MQQGSLFSSSRWWDEILQHLTRRRSLKAESNPGEVTSFEGHSSPASVRRTLRVQIPLPTIGKTLIDAVKENAFLRSISMNNTQMVLLIFQHLQRSPREQPREEWRASTFPSPGLQDRTDPSLHFHFLLGNGPKSCHLNHEHPSDPFDQTVPTNSSRWPHFASTSTRLEI